MERISVVIPYHDGSPYLGAALESVRGQSYPAHEIIIVDDGSRPDEAAALDRMAPEAVIVHLARNRGPSVARNVGVGRAGGEWIAFLDCDDRWEPNKLAAQIDYVRAHPECRAVHTGMRALIGDGTQIITRKEPVTFEDFLRFPCPVYPSSVLMHREALLESGLFDPTKRCCEDLDLFLRFAHEYPIHAIPEPLMIRRLRPDGLSQNLPVFWREADRVYREYRTVFADERAAGRTLLGLHVDFALRAIYARDFGLLWRMSRRALRRDVSLARLIPGVLTGLVHNRLHRHEGRPKPVALGEAA
jgi:glycosyltransferase involved in cell wall biosynthesis